MENRKYELLFLLKPNLEKTELEILIKDIESKLNGNLVKKEEWGLKPLAYKIQNFTEGYYVLYYVETTPSAINDLKQMIAINKNVLRPMIIRHEKHWPFEYKKTSKDLKFPERRNTLRSKPNYKRD